MESQYAIVETKGNRTYGARVSEVERFGIKMVRLEVLAKRPFIQDVHPQLLYTISPCDEEDARRTSQGVIGPQDLRELHHPDEVDL
jgi:hypothetical protein